MSLNNMLILAVNKQVLSKVIREHPCRHPSWQSMHLPAACATICTMPTADESNQSAASMLHPHRTGGPTTAYTMLNFPAD